MEKIRYRLVFNRKKELNKQGLALVQVEASLNRHKIYMSTNLYLKPEWWNKDTQQVINHPHSVDLNLMLWQFILDLQHLELEMWKRGVTPTLAMIKHYGRDVPDMTFKSFANKIINESDRSEKTKENLESTVRILLKFRPGINFKDITYTFLREFEQYLKEQGKSMNTVAKHLRQLRTIVNEAINHGLVKIDDYPFRKFKIKQEKGHFEWLTPNELKKIENFKTTGKYELIRDAFLFCCYTGLRYSDFVRLRPEWLEKINGKPWLHLFTKKTDTEIRLPLSLLFEGKAFNIISKYTDITYLARIPGNHDANVMLSEVVKAVKINKRVTWHCFSHNKIFCCLNINELSTLKNVTANDLETSYILILSQLCNIQRTL